MSINVYHNAISSRFEVNVNSGLCELDYEKVTMDTLEYKRTFVPKNLRHRGIGHELVKEALEYAKDQRYHVKPSCPFVRKVAEENKERYRDVIVWS